MTIKSSASPPPQLSFGEIETEFGQNGSRSLGDYRISQTVGNNSTLPALPLDTNIPTSGEIKFSDFYGKQLNIVVDCHSGGTEDRIIAKMINGITMLSLSSVVLEQKKKMEVEFISM